ncbi:MULTISPECIES: hypothetical protein [Pseudomonas]|uniref:hypothetical protein n=1 Tax=Pseudomonas TaxID=286 RepID=UPI0007C73317|nr:MULTISPECIES: hypothetical protein [Pseudomonas]GLO45565.1 hypothetical protein PPUN109347_21280 [Pseudomonas putida]HDS0978969.1 hypothetical protein [Pseudomonas putida]
MQKHTDSTRFFYQNGKLVTLKIGEQGRSILRAADVPLAETPTKGTHPNRFLATDDKSSVLNVQENT